MTEYAAYVMSTLFFRVVRIARFEPVYETVSSVLRGCFASRRKIQSILANLLSLLFILIFSYALIGLMLYGDVEAIFQNYPDLVFNNLTNAFILLFQISTGAGWDGVYLALINRHSTFGVLVYLLSFLAFAFLIYTNFVLVVVVQIYQDSGIPHATESDLCDFDEKWLNYASPEEPQYMSRDKFEIFLKTLSPSSGLRLDPVNETTMKLMCLPERKPALVLRSDALIAVNRLRLAKIKHQ